ncbi:hypothetical protein CEK26_011632 [Fusarium fujikuroi]|uniref:Uncharacterized protein n=1 Tax=Fusarium fujikuroi TaxID=5127 RepID=A0A5Q3F1X8_FUSFU|nr:hypothetical protein CEK27_011650 [Fusarium fujikuroi]QGI84908.1 hypothetical protein CEK25_011637 [Fusarium fujikuroi]QGI98563.1 hypothetical protein CEK26_011632 [Fusarium fujikuroi]VTT56374.1 unnamed protein product [Fusarium fujikuroi]VTT72494.1 unnamed protein product [Fusarium fujikuroi]
MTTQDSETIDTTASSSIWGDFVDSDGECDVEDACEPVDRYEEGLYLPICIGEVVADRYRIEHKLGHGGFSTVWMAHDMDQGKDVALKIMTANFEGEREFLRQNEIINYQPQQLLQALKALHDGGMVHRDLNSANVMFGLSSFEPGADISTKYQILGRPQKMELPTGPEMWKKGQLVAPTSPKDSFVVQDTITLGDFGLTIRSGTEVDFKLQGTIGYCAPELMHGINPTFASDMWSYTCIFAELYLKWPLFGPGFFGGGLRFIVGLLIRVLGPMPLSWKGLYEGGGEPEDSWYDQSRVPEPVMSLESRVTKSRDTLEPAEQQLVLSILRRGFSYLPEERLSAGELLEDASFKALMEMYGL